MKKPQFNRVKAQDLTGQKGRGRGRKIVKPQKVMMEVKQEVKTIRGEQVRNRRDEKEIKGW